MLRNLLCWNLSYTCVRFLFFFKSLLQPISFKWTIKHENVALLLIMCIDAWAWTVISTHCGELWRTSFPKGCDSVHWFYFLFFFAGSSLHLYHEETTAAENNYVLQFNQIQCKWVFATLYQNHRITSQTILCVFKTQCSEGACSLSCWIDESAHYL